MSKTLVNVSIVGLTRTTTSLGRALRAVSAREDQSLSFKVIGQDGDSQALKAASQIGALDERRNNARDAVKDAEIVITDLPLGVRDEVFEYFAKELNSGAVVLDLSLDKMRAVQTAREVFPKDAEGSPTAYLVGIHPTVNAKYLFDASQAIETAAVDLFMGGDLMIAPAVECPEEAVKLATDVANLLDMSPRYMSPAEFDAIAAYTEGFPQLLGLAMFASVLGSEGKLDVMRSLNPNFALMLNSLRNIEEADLALSWKQDREMTLHRIDDLIAWLGQLREYLQQDVDMRKHAAKLLDEFHLFIDRRERNEWEPHRTSSELSGFGLFGGLFGFWGKSEKEDSN